MQRPRRAWTIWLLLPLPYVLVLLFALDHRVSVTSVWHGVLVAIFVILVNIGFAAAFGWFTRR